MRPPWASGAVYAEQVRSSYAHLPLTLSVSVINSVLLGVVLASGVARPRILIWIGFVAGLFVGFDSARLARMPRCGADFLCFDFARFVLRVGHDTASPTSEFGKIFVTRTST